MAKQLHFAGLAAPALSVFVLLLAARSCLARYSVSGGGVADLLSHVRGLKAACSNPTLWVPTGFDAHSLSASGWQRYNSEGTPFRAANRQAYKGGRGLWWDLSLTSSGDDKAIQLKFNWDDHLYPGGFVDYAIWDGDFASVRSGLCSAIEPLPRGTILNDEGPLDTSTINLAAMMYKSHNTAYRSPSVSSLMGGSCKTGPVPFMMVAYLDYTNPDARVLGRYWASNGDEVTSDELCSDAAHYFKVFVFGVSCDCGNERGSRAPSPKPSPKRSPKPSPKRSPKPSPKRSPKPSPKRSPKPSPKRSPKPSPKRSG